MPQNLGTQYMLAQGAGANYEFLRNQCWAITIGGLDLTLLAQNVTIPTVTNSPITVHHFNEEVKGAGVTKTGNITVDILDAITPSVFQQLDEWFALVYDSLTGAMGYASEYKKQMRITQMDQKGAPMRIFIASGVWPTNAPAPDSLDYTKQDVVNLKMVFACDRVSARASTGTGGSINNGGVTI